MKGGEMEWHVLGLSGGRDSAALAVHMRQNHPELDIDYFFTDTGKELPEVYEFLVKLEGFLGKPILRLNPDRDFDFWAQAVQQLPTIGTDALVYAAVETTSFRAVDQADARERDEGIQLCRYPRR